MDNDYVIMIDENGQPYIAHGAVGDTLKRVWANRKALAVIPNYYENGRSLYVYSQQALANLRKRGNQMVKNAQNTIDKKLGISAKKKLNSGKNLTGQEQVDYSKSLAAKLDKTQRAAKKAQATVEKYGQDTMNNIRKKKKDIQDKAENIAETTSKNINKAVNAADKKIGVSATRNLKNENLMTTSEKGRNRAEYNQSLIGKTANAVNNTIDSAKNKATSTGEKLQTIKESVEKSMPSVEISGSTFKINGGEAHEIPKALLEVPNSIAAVESYIKGWFEKEEEEEKKTGVPR